MTPSTSTDDIPDKQRTEDRDPPVRLLVILLVGCVLIVVVWGAKQRGLLSSYSSNAAVGKQLERVELTPLIGEGANIRNGDLEGKVSLINFWGTWCKPCMIEFPQLVEMNNRLRAHPDFSFLPVACAPDLGQETGDRLRSETAAYLQRSEFALTVYSDPGGATRRAVLDRVGGQTFYFPTSVLLDREGVIRGLWTQYHEGLEAEMEEQINKLLES